MNMARGPQQSTYARLLRVGARIYAPADGRTIVTVLENAVVDEDGMVTVLLSGHDRPYTFDRKDRVKLY